MLVTPVPIGLVGYTGAELLDVGNGTGDRGASVELIENGGEVVHGRARVAVVVTVIVEGAQSQTAEVDETEEAELVKLETGLEAGVTGDSVVDSIKGLETSGTREPTELLIENEDELLLLLLG